MTGAIGGAAGGEGDGLGRADEEATGADPQHPREHQKLSLHDLSFRENGVQKVRCAARPLTSPAGLLRTPSRDVAPSFGLKHSLKRKNNVRSLETMFQAEKPCLSPIINA
jgi:hypothetical protein